MNRKSQKKIFERLKPKGQFLRDLQSQQTLVFRQDLKGIQSQKERLFLRKVLSGLRKK